MREHDEMLIEEEMLSRQRQHSLYLWEVQDKEGEWNGQEIRR